MLRKSEHIKIKKNNKDIICYIVAFTSELLIAPNVTIWPLTSRDRREYEMINCVL